VGWGHIFPRTTPFSQLPGLQKKDKIVIESHAHVAHLAERDLLRAAFLFHFFGFNPDLDQVADGSVPYRKRCFLRLKSQVREAIRLTALRLQTFDPAFCDQIRNDLRAVRQACGVDPAGASQVLHDLPLTGIRSFHFLTFRASTRRRMTSGRLIFRPDSVDRRCRTGLAYFLERIISEHRRFAHADE